MAGAGRILHEHQQRRARLSVHGTGSLGLFCIPMCDLCAILTYSNNTTCLDLDFLCILHEPIRFDYPRRLYIRTPQAVCTCAVPTGHPVAWR